MHVEYTVNKMFARINFTKDTLTCMQMRFVCNLQNNCNSSSGNMAVQHTVAIVLRAAVVPILGLSGTLAMCDRSMLRHDRVAVASEDAILPLPFHSHR